MLSLSRVLIAEDHDSVRRLLVQIVTRIYPSVAITAVANGALALAAYQAHGADLLIVNNDMPMMTGLALVQVLRAQRATIPILMISSTPALATIALIAGANRFLLKPFALSELQQTLIELLPLARQFES